MYVENLTLLWDATALTADAVSTNTYDAGVAENGLDIGEVIAAIITVDVAATVAGTETYAFEFIQSASAALTSADVLVRVPFTTTQASTLLKAGKKVVINVPSGAISKRFLGLNFDGANTPTITVTASMAPSSFAEVIKQFASGFIVSG